MNWKLLIRLLHNIFIWGLFLPFIGVHFILVLLGKMVVPRDFKWGYLMTQLCLGFVIFLSCIKIEVKYKQKIGRKKGYIIVANHQSMLDIAALFLTFKRHFGFIAKKQIRWIPLVGWSMGMMGHYFIDRENPKKAYASLSKVMEKLKKGRVLAVFPEGTRSKSGKIGRFKRGSFKMALETGVSVIPCCIDGARDLLPKKSLLAKFGKMKVIYGAPISVNKVDFSNLSREEEKKRCDQLANLVRDAVLELQEELKAK